MPIGTPTDIGSATLTSSSTTSIDMTTTAAAAVGDLVIVTVTNDGGANLPSGVTDSRGNTYTADHAGVRSADDYSLRQFSAVLTTALQVGDTITGAIDGGGGTWDKIISAVKVTPDSGRSWGSGRIDQTASASGTSTSPDSGLTGTTTDADALIYGCMAAGGAPVTTGGGPLTTATNGNTKLHNINAGTGGFIDMATVYQVVTATGTYRSSGTWQASDDWGCICVAYKQQAAGGDPYVGAGAAATAASGDITPALPGSLQEGDALVLDLTARDNVDCSVSPSGGSGNAWTRKGSHNNGTELRKEVWWKRRGASDADTGAAVTHTGGGKIIGRVHAFRVPGTGDPFEAASFESVAAAASGDFPDITTLSADAILMYGLGYAEDFTTGPSITAAQGLTLTERDETEVS